MTCSDVFNKDRMYQNVQDDLLEDVSCMKMNVKLLLYTLLVSLQKEIDKHIQNLFY